MTKSQIKAELRRSACEDERPYREISTLGFEAAREYVAPCSWLCDLKEDDLRTFFLLVAEAL